MSEEKTSTAIVLDERANSIAFEPNNLDSAIMVAEKLVKSRLLPKAVTTAEAALAIIMTGREFGLTVMQSFRTLHVIDGKVSMSADLIVGLIKKHPDCEYFTLAESTDKVATYVTKRRQNKNETRCTFTIEDAKRAGLLGKDNWIKYPRSMLARRAGTELGHAEYPDVIGGLYDPDEMESEQRAAPTPISVVSSVVNGSKEPLTDAAQALAEVGFHNQIVEAKTKADLTSIAGAIKKSGISGDYRKRLLVLYDQRKAELTPPNAKPSEPKVPDSPPSEPVTNGQVLDAIFEVVDHVGQVAAKDGTRERMPGED